MLSYAHNIFMCDPGFECLYYSSHRPRRCSVGAILVIARIWFMIITRANTRFAPTINNDDPVDMVRHDNKFIQFDVGEMCGYALPTFLRHQAGIIQNHFPV